MDTTNWIESSHLAEGRGFSDVGAFYSRLPASAFGVVRDAVWNLAQSPAGQYISFESNTSSLSLNYTLGSSELEMWHFPRAGMSGADLYIFDDEVKYAHIPIFLARIPDVYQLIDFFQLLTHAHTHTHTHTHTKSG